jgi:hypothetical protein
MDREALAWAAGIFDGEGTFSTRTTGKRDRGIIAKLKMTDEDIVRRFFKVIKVGNMTGPYFAPNKKPVWIWQTGSFEGVQHTMASLWEWLGIRRRARIKSLLNGYHSWETIR